MNILKINGQALEGIYVDAAISFNKPAKRVSTYSVPGRNGDLVIDEGTFDNVLITYPVFEKSTFPTKFDEIVNYLASLEGYQPIECSNDPQHYRLGRFVVPQNPTAKWLNRDGYWQLSFDCKPQRWLLTGEEETEIDQNPIDEYSGALVSFEGTALDEITELKAAIEPVQNLNGQTSPWPAGGGKNKILLSADAYQVSQKCNATYENNGGTFAATGSYSYVRYHYTVEIGQTYVLSFKGSASGDYNHIYVGSTMGTYDYKNFTLTGTETDYSASFTASTTDLYIQPYITAGGTTGTMYVKNLQLEVGNTATTYAPYSNICPISGHTEVNVYRTGKNLADYDAIAQINSTASNIRNGLVFTKAGNYVASANATNSGSGQIIYARKYTKSTDSYGTATVLSDGGTQIASQSYTIDEGDRLIVFHATPGVSIATSKALFEAAEIQVELGTTATSYEPYAGTTYPISLGQTVYGGTLNVTTGVLTITHKLGTTAGNESSMTVQSDSGHLFRVTWSGVAPFAGLQQAYPTGCKCNTYGRSGTSYADMANNSTNMAFAISGTIGSTLLLSDSSVASTADMTARITASPIEVYYPLATPTTVQLTPTEVTTLLGQNNIWADTGDVEVKVTTPTVFNNPSLFNSKPLIRVYGIGTFRVNDITVTIASHDKPYIDIDCELQECYYGSENMNEYVSFSGNDFPELQPGDNYMLLASGITKLDVTPRWWVL